jgi:exocyst complex component 5
MEQLLNRGAALSDLAYLRVLQLVHAQASLSVEDLKTYELPSAIPRSPAESGDTRRLSSENSTALGSGTSSVVSTMLETALDELFVPYTEGQRYLERESRSLGSLYSGLLMNFTRYHVCMARLDFVNSSDVFAGEDSQGKIIVV